MVSRPVDDIKFDLHPLELERTYSEIEVEIQYFHDDDQGGYCKLTKDPKGLRYEEIRPLVERMLKRAYEALQLQTA